MQQAIKIVMANNRLGVTVIDKLRLCYKAEPDIIESLKHLEIGMNLNVGNFLLHRTGSCHFVYEYDVVSGDTGNREKIASLHFGRYGDIENVSNVYYWVENKSLYNRDKLETAMRLPDILCLTYNNFTALDLTRDFRYNTVYMLRRLYRNPVVNLILNGKVIDKQSEDVIGVISKEMTMLKDRHPSITFMQAKAKKNKSRGIVVQAYNKLAELNVSEKPYITSFYGNPKSLHRLEVRIPSESLMRLSKSINPPIEFSPGLIYDQQSLDSLYIVALSSVIRFSKGRHPIKWEDILACNGKCI